MGEHSDYDAFFERAMLVEESLLGEKNQLTNSLPSNLTPPCQSRRKPKTRIPFLVDPALLATNLTRWFSNKWTHGKSPHPKKSKRWLKAIETLSSICGLSLTRLYKRQRIWNNRITRISHPTVIMTNPLEFIHPHSSQIKVPPIGTCKGTTLLIAPSLTILSSRTILDSQAAWAKIKGSKDDFGVISIYSPNIEHEHAILWHNLKVILPNGRWILCSDLDMTSKDIDSLGPSPQQRKGSLETS